jgi:peptide-methionine (S)-S-oxide reductase
MDAGKGLEKATVGGGCFWCLEPLFRDLVGVEDVVVGYAGGSVEDPTYQQVCTGSTGHAEVVQISFAPAAISYKQLLEVFFTVHDPTTLNRQGPDVGTQYRSIILYHDESQKAAAEEVMAQVEQQKIWDDPLVTDIEPLDEFYPAEKYHQRYYEKNPNQGYCAAIIAPKVKKFRQKWQEQLKAAEA